MKLLYLATLCLSFLKICSIDGAPDDKVNKTKLIEMSSSYILSRAIHIAAQLKIADEMVNEPQNITSLALKTNLNEDALYRLLRFLASYNIFHHDKNNNFSLTPLSELLVSTNPDSLQPWVAYHHDNNRWIAYADMQHCIKTGDPAFNHIFGTNFFDFITQSPELSNHFDIGMKNISCDENSLIALSYTFSPHSHIVDIGSGIGGLAIEIIKHNPTVQALLFDLPHLRHSAHDFIAQHFMNDKITFVESTGFFDPIPQAADIYILKRILHDWNDQECLTILQNCYNSMDTNSRLLIVEAILTKENVRDFGKDIDIEMMVLFGGKERTHKEWLSLLQKAHLEIVAIHTTHSLLSIIEVKKNRTYINE